LSQSGAQFIGAQFESSKEFYGLQDDTYSTSTIIIAQEKSKKFKCISFRDCVVKH